MSNKQRIYYDHEPALGHGWAPAGRAGGSVGSPATAEIPYHQSTSVPIRANPWLNKKNALIRSPG